MNLNKCHNFDDYRKLAKKKLPSPIYHYIDGGAERKSGKSIFCPRTVVDKSTLLTSFNTSGIKSQSLNDSVFLFKVISSSAPPSI